jgi:hypothetical protein
MTMKSLIAQVDAGDPRGESLVGWRVSPNTRVRVSDAGGQMRAVGRSISRAYAASVQGALTNALNAVQSTRATTEMQELYAHVHSSTSVGISDDPASQPPVTVFISSLAGGTGAGLIFDVVDIYRSLEPDLMDLTVGIWFTPDAFPESYGQGLRPNALAAISEMLNGAWWLPQSSTSTRGAAIPVRDTRALESVAGLPNTIDRSGVWANYLVGQTNIAGHRMDNDGRLFEKVGGALLSWIVDPELNDRLVSKVLGNLDSTREYERIELPWNYGSAAAVMDSSSPPIFDALGFSRVSLGTRYFARYSTERLTRRVVDHLVRAHIDSDWAKSEKKTSGLSNPTQLSEYMAGRRYAGFRDVLDVEDDLSEPDRRELLANSRENTDQEEALGAIYGKVIEKALEPDVLQELKNKKTDDLIQYAQELDPMPIGEWADQLLPVINDDIRIVLRQAVTDALYERIESWAKKASERTVARAEEAVGAFGLEIAQRILDMLSLEIRDIAMPALKRLEEESVFTGSVNSVHQEFYESLGAEFGDTRKVAAEQVSDAIRAAIEAVSFDASAEVLRRAGLMLGRYRDGLLRPISTQLGAASSRLDARHAETKTFPTSNDAATPPAHLLPPESESTVIENDDFGKIFGGLLLETFGSASPAQADDAAVAELASGSFVRRRLSSMSQDDLFLADYERVQVINLERNWSVGLDLGSSGHAFPLATLSRWTSGRTLKATRGVNSRFSRSSGKQSQQLSHSLSSTMRRSGQSTTRCWMRQSVRTSRSPKCHSVTPALRRKCVSSCEAESMQMRRRRSRKMQLRGCSPTLPNCPTSTLFRGLQHRSHQSSSRH